MTTLNQLHIGDSAVLEKVVDQELEKQLSKMGLLPGESITLKRIAPLGDPIIIQVSDFELCLRKEDAMSIHLELL